VKFQKIRGDIALQNFTSRILQTNACNVHYTVVVATTLCHSSIIETCLSVRLNNVTRQQNSQAVPKNQPNFLSVCSLSET